MTKIENQKFSRLFDRGDSLRIEDVIFQNCSFEACALSLTKDISKISKIRDVSLIGCSVNGCETGPAVFSNVMIDNLKTNDLFILWCPYFDRVTISGNVGRMKINSAADPSIMGSAAQKPFDDYRVKFYEGVEWALDISRARFRDFDFLGIPGRMIRRDPNSQILITRERALQVAKPGWEKNLNSKNKIWPFAIKLFLNDGDPDTVLVAPLGAPKEKRDLLLNGLQELREIGLAEPD